MVTSTNAYGKHKKPDWHPAGLFDLSPNSSLAVLKKYSAKKVSVRMCATMEAAPNDSATMTRRGDELYGLDFQEWVNSFRVWSIPLTLKVRVCFE